MIVTIVIIIYDYSEVHVGRGKIIVNSIMKFIKQPSFLDEVELTKLINTFLMALL